MIAVEKTGRTVEEATRAALAELGVERDKAIIEVLEEGRSGFFGLGMKPAKVRVSRKDPREEGVASAQQFLKDLISHMDVGNASITVEQLDGAVRFDVSGKNLGTLIGRRGQTLDAIQYLVNLVANRVGRSCGELSGEEERIRIIVDAQGYRKRREDALRSLARRVAERVRREGRTTLLEPMTPMERRIVHLALQDVEGVTCHSEGEEPRRRIVISPAGPRLK
ncbi:MAG TPA: protein jag [Firmicutes bacterium]|nr:protein jag [Bacillota bacterium]